MNKYFLTGLIVGGTAYHFLTSEKTQALRKRLPESVVGQKFTELKTFTKEAIDQKTLKPTVGNIDILLTDNTVCKEDDK